MRLRTKLSLIFALCTVVSVGCISCFSSIKQQESFTSRELKSQQQVINLLTNTLSGQYYNYINNQITSIIEKRKELSNYKNLLKSNLDDYQYENKEALKEYFAWLQQKFKQYNLDMIVMDGDKIFLAPLDKTILTNKSVNNQSLIDTMKIVMDRNSSDYMVTNLNEGYNFSNYICYIFNQNYDTNYTVSIASSIDDLVQKYNDTNKTLISQLRENFLSLNDNLTNTALIFDKNTKEILISSKNDEFTTNKDLSNIIFDAINTKNANQDYATISVGNTEYLVYWQYYKPLSWYIVTAIDRYTIIQPAIEQTYITISIGFLTLILVILISTLFTRRITQTLSNIAKKAQELSNAKLDNTETISKITADIKVVGNDEVSILSRTIKNMGESISKNVKQLMETLSINSKIQSELNAARDIQLGMLIKNDEMPQSKYIDIYAYLHPAKEVGGDFYDAFRLDDDKICITIGDVSDKGMPAALFMSTTINLARSFIKFNIEPKECLKLINNHLSLRNPNMMFVTMVILVISESTGKFVLANAGHCLPIIINKDGCTEIDHISGPAVGPIEDLTYDQIEGTLDDGANLLIYTDGVSEAQNEAKEFFETTRILDICKQNLNSDPCNITEKLIKAVADFRKDYIQTDDITTICIKRHNQ